MPAQDVVGWRVQSLFLGNRAMGESLEWCECARRENILLLHEAKTNVLFLPIIGLVTTLQTFNNVCRNVVEYTST